MIQDFTNYVAINEGQTVTATVEEFFMMYNGGLTADDFEAGDFPFLLFDDESKSADDVMKYLEKYRNKKIKIGIRPYNNYGQYEYFVEGLPDNAAEIYDTIATSFSELKDGIKEAKDRIKKGI